MESTFLLYVVIWQSSSIFQLFTSKNQPLLIRWNTFLVLYFSFHILYRIRGLYFKGNSFPSQRLHKYLHTTTQTKNQMESTFLLYVVIWQSSSIFQLLASKNQPLLIRWDTLLVLDFSLHVLDRIRRLHLEGDGFTSERFHEYLHSSSQSQHQMQRAFLLDIVIR